MKGINALNGGTNPHAARAETIKQNALFFITFSAGKSPPSRPDEGQRTQKRLERAQAAAGALGGRQPTVLPRPCPCSFLPTAGSAAVFGKNVRPAPLGKTESAARPRSTETVRSCAARLAAR